MIHTGFLRWQNTIVDIVVSVMSAARTPHRPRLLALLAVTVVHVIPVRQRVVRELAPSELQRHVLQGRRTRTVAA